VLLNPFVASSRILSVIRMSQMYACKPSEIVNIQDEYEAFCFNEACALIKANIEEEKQPKFRKKYGSFKSMYRSFERR